MNWWWDVTDYCDFKLSAGTSPFMDALTANGTTSIQTSVTGVTASKRKFIDDRRDQPFDKRLRFSVRQTESAYRYRDIVVRKQDGFTHILLSTKSSENNSLNPEVRGTLGLAWASRFSLSDFRACLAELALPVLFLNLPFGPSPDAHQKGGSRGEVAGFAPCHTSDGREFRMLGVCCVSVPILLGVGPPRALCLWSTSCLEALHLAGTGLHEGTWKVCVHAPCFRFHQILKGFFVQTECKCPGGPSPFRIFTVFPVPRSSSAAVAEHTAGLSTHAHCW